MGRALEKWRHLRYRVEELIGGVFVGRHARVMVKFFEQRFEDIPDSFQFILLRKDPSPLPRQRPQQARF